MASVVQQHRLVAVTPASAPLPFGLNSSAIYLGVAAGGFIGGGALEWMVPTLHGVPAAILAVLATLVTVAQSGQSRTRVAKPDPDEARRNPGPEQHRPQPRHECPRSSWRTVRA